jgi:hypothetical protein
MTAIITTVTAVRPLGISLSVVSLAGVEHQVVANRLDDGSFRWSVNEPVIYLSEGTIVPDDVMRERGYWNDEKDRGGLEGKKHNTVKLRRFGPEEDRVESRGLLFKIEHAEELFDERGIKAEVFPVRRGTVVQSSMSGLYFTMGADVSEFLGLTEKTPG